MTYTVGGLIEAVDYNTFRNQVDDVYGVGFGDSGYGQSAIALPTVAGGLVELIKSVEWTNLRSAIDTCATHQGSTVNLPPASEVAVGALVKAHTSTDNPGDISTSISTIFSNRLIAAPAAVSLFANRLTSSRDGGWSNQLIYECAVDFGTVDQARYFFNSGGRIQFRASRSGGSATQQNSSWTSLLSNVGSVQFNYNNCVSLNGVGTPQGIGYYNMVVGSYGLVYLANASGADYNANSFQIFAQTADGPSGPNGDNGRLLRFRLVFTDGYAGGSFSGPDVVNGTLSAFVDEIRATGPLTIAAPSYSTLVGVSGS